MMNSLAVMKILWVCGWEGWERFVGEDLIFWGLCMRDFSGGLMGYRVYRLFWIRAKYLLEYCKYGLKGTSSVVLAAGEGGYA